MSFLTPLFLIGLTGLAIPVLLHLIQRERKQIVAFPSLMFLRRIPYQSVQRRRIRNWLLLMMRLAALALIVLAFGRPFFRGTDPALVAAGGALEIVLLVDRSYSMAYGDRWTRALNAARSAVDEMSPVDRASLVFFGSVADVALRSTSDKGRLYSALASADLSSGGTHYGPVLKLAGSILSESTLPRREVILVTDFQRVGWRGADGVRLPDGTVLTPMAIGDAEVNNLSVTPVAIERSTFSNQERVTVTAGVTNHGDRAVNGVEVALDINGRTIQTLQVSVEPHASGSTTFAPVTVTDAEVRATVRLADDALMPDNTFHFVVAAGRPVRTLLVDRAAGREALYLARALSVGDAPRFETVARAAEGVTADDLQSANLVIVNDVQVSSALATQLGAFVERGGGLLVIAGQRGTWPQAAATSVPALPSEAVDRSRGQPARLVALEYGHPVFEPFRAPRSGDFSAARFYGYRALSLDPEATVLARFEDGAPALVERRVGAGRVLVWASSLDIEWNDFPVKPVFLPFVHQVARYLAAYRQPEPWLTVGDVLDPSRRVATPASDIRTVLSPSAQRLSLDPEGGDVVMLEEQGFYELREQPAGAGGPAATIAANVDLSESDLTPMDPREVVAAVAGGAAAFDGEGDTYEMTDATREATQRFWWYLLFAGAVLLSAETLVSNRMGTRA
jgi:hypothetical protein